MWSFGVSGAAADGAAGAAPAVPADESGAFGALELQGRVAARPRAAATVSPPTQASANARRRFAPGAGSRRSADSQRASAAATSDAAGRDSGESARHVSTSRATGAGTAAVSGQ